MGGKGTRDSVSSTYVTFQEGEVTRGFHLGLQEERQRKK